ncbi:MAG: hypothetical protein SFT92_08615 [Rickettsiales bacterium]|nr:hypothetical protein [Rickettsiales bacterium]
MSAMWLLLAAAAVKHNQNQEQEAASRARYAREQDQKAADKRAHEEAERDAFRQRKAKEEKLADDALRAEPISEKEMKAVANIMDALEGLREQGNQDYFDAILKVERGLMFRDFHHMWKVMDGLIQDPDQQVTGWDKTHIMERVLHADWHQEQTDFNQNIFIMKNRYLEPAAKVEAEEYNYLRGVIRDEATPEMQKLIEATAELQEAYRTRKADDMLDRFKRTVSQLNNIAKSDEIREAAKAGDKDLVAALLETEGAARVPDGKGQDGDPASRVNPEPGKDRTVQA